MRRGVARMAGSRAIQRVTVVLAFLLLWSGTFQQASAATRAADANAMNGLSQAWLSNSKQLNWVGDPCETPWTGVFCDPTNTFVTELVLDSQGLTGSVPPAIGGLNRLTTLELSSNPFLTGSLPPEIGNLTSLQKLSLQYCGFTGQLPTEVGNLLQLNFLGLNGNNFSGPLPPELGNTNLTWMDISVNQFSEAIPMSSNSRNSAGIPLGLDNITNIVHFHMNNNSFTGSVPKEIFSLPSVQHVLLDHNGLTGTLPNITSFSSSLTVIRVDYNNLQGEIPSGFQNGTSLMELNLKNNNFSGPLPNLSGLSNLSLLDLSQNDFNPGPFPSWAESLKNISVLNLAAINLTGGVPSQILNLSQVESIDLSDNHLNGTLTFDLPTGPELAELFLQNNNISGFAGQPTNDPSNTWNLTLWLQNNPICHNAFISIPRGCTGDTLSSQTFHHPSVDSCFGKTDSVCHKGKLLNPYTCSCGLPLMLNILLTAPTFSNLDTAAMPLESDLASKLNLSRNQTYVENMVYNSDARVLVSLRVFPVSGGGSLDPAVSSNITNTLRQHGINLEAGPYLLPLSVTADATSSGGLSTSSIIGIAVGCVAGLLIVAASIFFAVYHKMRADRAVSSNPFASWGGGSSEFGEAPKLKGSRWFSLAELKACTDNWSDDNQIGVGGYGKVYRGVLSSGELVAIKRATEGSMQGANEFKNEIELLSRVHHRNLVGLVGFCYEGGEQALVYEFMSNGTLLDHLKGRGDIPLSWEKRLEIALASAIGVSYLHNHASPPIIHRDLKSANILLNDKMVAKVADFGLSKLAPDEGEKLVYSVNVKGTLGYLDPEYYMTQNLTDKSDVYSFGVVLLEILTARPPIDGGRFVVREFRTALDKGGVAALRPLMDPVLKDVSVHDLDAYLKIALSCVEEGSADRPTTAEIVKLLEALDVFGQSFSQSKSGMKAMDIEGGGGKKVKFADDFTDSDRADLLGHAPLPHNDDSFLYSGAYGVSTTVKPK